jgi:pimeloyl-ACP methyl ester carboxylesterase
MLTRKIIGKITWRALRFLLLLWLALFLLQRQILYHPTKDSQENIAIEAQHRNFEPWQSSKGETIGYQSLTPHNDPRRHVAILITHGNAGSALDRTDFALLLREALPELAISFYILEYPGYGAREGKPSQASFIEAAQNALSQIPESPVILFGESIGTGVASALATESPHRIAGLLLVTPFDSLVNVAQRKFPFIPARLFVLDPYPSSQWLQMYNGPMTIIVAGKDSVIPPRHAHNLYEDYTGPKELIKVPNADHNDVAGLLTLEEWAKAVHFILSNPADHETPEDVIFPQDH